MLAPCQPCMVKALEHTFAHMRIHAQNNNNRTLLMLIKAAPFMQ